MGLLPRVSLVAALVIGVNVAPPGVALAGPVSGKLELPAPPVRPKLAGKGFLDRIENPLAPVKPIATTPYMLVVLENDAAASATPGQITWELVGDSFAKPVIGVQVGGKVEMKNTSTTPRTLSVKGQPKLIEGGPLNPKGVRSFRAAEPGVLEIVDSEATYLHGVVVVVPTPYFANPDAAGKFDLGEVPEGTYKLRVFYGDRWIDRPDEQVVVGKTKVEVTVKIPAGFPLKK